MGFNYKFMGINTQDNITRTRRCLGDLLLEENLITQEQLDIAINTQQIEGIRLGEALLKLEFIKPQDLAAILSVQLNLPYIDLQRHKIQPQALRLIPEFMARKHILIPMDVVNDCLMVVMADPQDIQTTGHPDSGQNENRSSSGHLNGYPEGHRSQLPL
jgi:hypothetical protein